MKKLSLRKDTDMKNIKPSARQRTCRRSFAYAVRYARGILNDAIQREKLARSIKRGETVYHAAIRRYLMMMKETEKRREETVCN